MSEVYGVPIGRLFVTKNGEKTLIGEVDRCAIVPHDSVYTVTCDHEGAECVKEVCIRESIDYTFNLVQNTPIADTVPREEYESLLRRFRHLLESDYIRSFDEVIPLAGGKYKRDIREADLENQRAHWIANCTCSRCLRGVRGYAIQSGYVFCPFCGADMREVHE